MVKELSQDELRAALAAADRGLRFPWSSIVVGASITALAVGFGLKALDWSNPTHVLIVCAVGVVYAQMTLLSGVIVSRQNAANARMLRALALLDERLPSS